MKLDSIVTIVLVACALMTTALVARREFLSSSINRSPVDHEAVAVAHWEDYFETGHKMGAEQTPVRVIEFADFECPYCGRFHKSLKMIEAKYPGKIAATYVHFPISGHRFALPAARVAECAGDQGKFQAMHDALFEGQDQFGLKPWDDYATAAGVPDTAAFDTCIKKTDLIPRVEEGKALGAKLDVQGTPTIVINGWKLAHPPSEQELDQMVQRILAGKQPVDTKS